MLFWKLLVALDLLIAAGYWRAVWKGNERLDAFDFVSIPVALVGTIGLISYAFSIPAFSSLIWRVFLPTFIAVCGWDIADAAKGRAFSAETVFSVIPALLLVGFTSVALYRLGGSHWIGIGGL